LVVSSSKYTGAAAVAEHLTRSLRLVGVDADLLFLSGRNLEERLAGEAWAFPLLVKERRFGHLVANLRAIRRATDGVDVVISHLPHDHLLCVVAGVHCRCALVRNFRRSRHLRRDPWHRALARPVRAALLAHTALEAKLELLAPVPYLALPVPVEERFQPGVDGSPWRQRLAIPPGVPVLGMVGKLARGRGFDLLLATAARLGNDLHVLVVGHGEEQSRLERLATRLGIAERVRWAGHQIQELPALHAAMDVVLFTGLGTDHGHRAISEAQACGRPLVAAALLGVSDLVQDGRSGRIVAPSAEAFAAAVAELLAKPDTAAALSRGAIEAVAGRRFRGSGERLAAFLAGVLPSESDMPRA